MSSPQLIGVPIRHRKPYIPFKPAERLKRGKAMTMVAGFVCSDGVVLCADTEMTIPGWVKFPGAKILIYNKLKCRAAFAFAGDEMFCVMFMDKLIRRIHSAEKERKDVVTSIEDEALVIHQKFMGEQYEAEATLILSLWQGAEGKKRRRLYSIAQGIVQPVQKVSQGTGKPVTQGMFTELFSPDMSMNRTALFAIYLLAEAKIYGSGVGKDSQILLLEHSGGWWPFPVDPYYSTIKEVEEDYIHLKRLLKPILVAYSDLAIDESAFSVILGNFGKWAVNHRKKRRAAYEHLIEREIERQIAWGEDAEEDNTDVYS